MFDEDGVTGDAQNDVVANDAGQFEVDGIEEGR